MARAVELLLTPTRRRIAGQAFNCYDLYVAEEHVARIAKELTGSRGTISDLNRGPKNQIDTGKIRALGHDLRRRNLAASDGSATR